MSEEAPGSRPQAPGKARHGRSSLLAPGAWLLGSFAACLLLLYLSRGAPIVAFGRVGLGDGEFREPRTVAVSAKGVAVIDRSGRLQLFDADGRFLSKFLVAGPNVRRGLPCGVTWLADGNLAVADTHQGYVQIYAPDGTKVSHFGGFGAELGEFNFPQRVAELADGRLAVSDYGISLCNRVQVLTRDGRPLLAFGGGEPEKGGLARPMGIVPREDGSFVVADQRAGLVVFDKDGVFRGPFGGHGPERPPPATATPEGSGAVEDEPDVPTPGTETLLYGLCRAADGTFYASDIGRHRLLRVSKDGTVTGTFGRNGDALGEFREPWDVAWSGGRLYVADKGNHRVQRLEADRVTWETQ